MESFKTRGTWWLPGSNKKIIGTVSVNDTDGIFLQTDDLFPSVLHSIMNAFPIIYGEAYRKKFTLIHSYAVGPHGEKPGYRPTQLLEGCHINDVSEKFVTGIIFALDDTEKWLRVSGFKHAIVKKEKGVSVRYSKPEPVPFNINENIAGSFIFNYDVEGKITKEVKIMQDVQTRLNFKGSLLTYEAALSHFATFYQFLTFSIQHLPTIRHIMLETKDETDNTKTKKVNFYFKLRETGDSFNGHYLFYKDELTDFDKVISHWFTLDKKISPTLKILFETYFPDTAFNENSFLNQCQAIETFHRTLYPTSEEVIKQFKERVDAIAAKLDSAESKWLKTKMHYGYEPTLKERLDFLITKVDDLACVEKLKLDTDFNSKVVANRNYYTHYGDKKNKTVVEGRSLMSVTVRVKVLLMFLVLDELGFDHTLIDLFVKEGRFSNWAFLMATEP